MARTYKLEPATGGGSLDVVFRFYVVRAKILTDGGSLTKAIPESFADPADAMRAADSWEYALEREHPDALEIGMTIALMEGDTESADDASGPRQLWTLDEFWWHLRGEGAPPEALGEPLD